MEAHPAAPTRMATARRRLLTGLGIGVLVIALTVSAVSLALADSPSFPDVPSSHPYHVAITALAANGVVSGYSNGSFGPADEVMRQQFAKMVVLAGGYPVSEADVCAFTDVPKGGASTLYPDNFIAVCAARGITVGKTATTFDPYSNITRYQVISMVVRAADDLQAGLLATPPSGWTGTWGGDVTHGANADRAEYNGLLAGLTLASLDPAGKMTRGEVAQVLYNLMFLMAPPVTTTTSAATTTTTLVATTTTSSTTTSSSTTSSSTTTTVDYENLGGQLTSGPAVASSGANRLQVFARGTTSEVMQKSYDGEWSIWRNVGGSVHEDSAPGAISWGAHPIDLFIRGTDDALWYNSHNGSTWSGWESLGGTLTSGPAVASTLIGQLDVFARGDKGQLIHNSYFGDWSGWETLGGDIKAGSSPAVVSYGGDHIDIFVRGTNDHLWHKAWLGGTWSAWIDLGGPGLNGKVTSSPAVSSRAPGQLDVFVRGQDYSIWHRTYSDYGTWSAWENMTWGLVASGPAAVSWGIDRIDLFVLGNNNAIMHKWWDGSAWLP